MNEGTNSSNTPMEEAVYMKPNNEVVIDDGRIESIEEFRSPEALYQDLILRVQKYHPSDDISLIEKAYHVAEDAHRDQVRKSGEAYIVHPLYVAIILADLEMDKETIAAGLLHDVVEDTVMTPEALRAEFGVEVALLVDGVTKLQQLTMPNRDEDKRDEDRRNDRLEMQAENLRKMFLAMARDIRVIIIKLADRLHNMRTLKYQHEEGQQRIARETLDIYAPIADRLGISRIKVELDDLSLKYLEPEAYYDLVEKVADRRSTREKYIQNIVSEISEHIADAGIKAEVDGRIKHFFSIYKKMKNNDRGIDQIYDLFAVRIIVDSLQECYSALGVIHELYTPISSRFKDYIAVPKPNMYRSLHSTVIGTGGQPFEIQIRTYEMHKAAEYGIAAHWKYKEASDGKKASSVEEKQSKEEEKLQWLRQILEWQRDMADNKEFMNSIKNDLNLFSDSVYCFTPNGEIKNLPAGSTPIDFAYSIHSAVGNKMIGARVNGKLVTIDYVINNGDRIEIMTSQNSKGPSRDWLNIVKSTQARNKINQWFRSEFKVENIVRGKELLTHYCRTRGINIHEILKAEYMEALMKKYGFHDWDSVLAAVGHGGLKEGQIINKLVEAKERKQKNNLSDEDVLDRIAEGSGSDRRLRVHSRSGIVVKGVDDVAVRFSKCCSPLPGDAIIGFVTRGRGVSIHRTDCVNILNLTGIEKDRLIAAEWQRAKDDLLEGKYLADIKIFAENRNGLLADISRVMAERKIDINSLNTRVNKQGMAIMSMSFEVVNREELVHITDKIRGIGNVIDIERTTG